MEKIIAKDKDSGEVFAVATLEGEGENGADIFQSVFPTRLSEHSQLHTTPKDACQYIADVMYGDTFGFDLI